MAMEGFMTITNDILKHAENIERIEEVKMITFSDDVEVIPREYFANCEILEEVVFSHSVKEIKEMAFQGCTSLTKLSFQPGIKMGFKAFAKCVSLKSLVIPNCSEIAHQAFMGCSAVETISLPKDCVIGIDAFKGCKSIREIQWEHDDNELNIGSTTFASAKKLYKKGFLIIDHCLIDYKGKDDVIIIPDEVEIIGSRAFEMIDASKIVLNKGLKKVCRQAFFQCVNLYKENIEMVDAEYDDNFYVDCPDKFRPRK